MMVKKIIKPKLAPKHSTVCHMETLSANMFACCKRTDRWQSRLSKMIVVKTLRACKAFSYRSTSRKSADGVLAAPVIWPGENTSSLMLVCCVNLQNRITLLARCPQFPSHHWWGIACFWEGDQPRRSCLHYAKPCPESCRSICQSQTCAPWSWYSLHNEWSPSVQCQALLQPAWHQLQLVEQGYIKVKCPKVPRISRVHDPGAHRATNLPCLQRHICMHINMYNVSGSSHILFIHK